MKKKALLIRLDKIGDLICTLPVDQVLDKSEYDVTWVVQKGLGAVVDLGQQKRNYVEIDRQNPDEASGQLDAFIKEFKPDIAVSFQCPWWVNYELFKNRVPVRAGVKSQWHSFLFLNRGLRQKRSRAEKHEFDYNLELVKKTFAVREPPAPPYFQIAKPGAEALEKFRLSTPYAVVHPGMMGSALNWPQSEYIKTVHRLLAKNLRVVITGTAADEPYLTEIKKEFANHPGVTWLQSKLNFGQLIQVLAHSQFVLAPSTGVAHLAASVGANTKGIYSPVTVHHPRRWAPRGPHVEIFMLPEVKAECF